MNLWEILPDEKKINLMKMEENATSNQVILFVQRVIQLRTPVELPEGTCMIENMYVCVHVACF